MCRVWRRKRHRAPGPSGQKAVRTSRAVSYTDGDMCSQGSARMSAGSVETVSASRRSQSSSRLEAFASTFVTALVHHFPL
jgi:hypothetical protein